MASWAAAAVFRRLGVRLIAPFVLQIGRLAANGSVL